MITTATALDAFEAELLAGAIATRVLEKWSGGRVRAEVATGVTVAASAATRGRLGVSPDAALRFRRVRLMCGDVVLSRADNWFVPHRLTADMLDALRNSDRPFAMVIGPLGPTREVLASERLTGNPMLRVSALVRAGDGACLAEVVEYYARAVLDGAPASRIEAAVARSG